VAVANRQQEQQRGDEDVEVALERLGGEQAEVPVLAWNRIATCRESATNRRPTSVTAAVPAIR
jgi:hypothetical protein